MKSTFAPPASLVGLNTCVFDIIGFAIACDMFALLSGAPALAAEIPPTMSRMC